MDSLRPVGYSVGEGGGTEIIEEEEEEEEGSNGALFGERRTESIASNGNSTEGENQYP